MSLKELAARTPLRKVTWREGTKGKLSGRFAWLRVWPASGWATGDCAGAEPLWLLIEEQATQSELYERIGRLNVEVEWLKKSAARCG